MRLAAREALAGGGLLTIGCLLLTLGNCGGTGGTGDGGARDVAVGNDATGTPDGRTGDAADPGEAPSIGGCRILPANHIFNTPIEGLPVSPSSKVYMDTIGTRNLHLDLGQSTDMSEPDTYWGIPFNVVHGASMPWVRASYSSTDPDMSWDPRPESDCVDSSWGIAHTVVSPCEAAAAPQPVLPIPATPLVEGGMDADPSQPYADHHILLLDVDGCRLWELYHAYPTASGWDIFGSATFDLDSNALRPEGWTSADAAGFPILPLLLRADEASAGVIRHALRFTIQSSKIRRAYEWPARHLTTNGTTSTNLPPMGQLFRLKASYQIPASFNTQARAILQALKTYGMYIADGGSDMYIQGEPSAAWQDDTFSQVQSVSSIQFEAVDLTPIRQRTGFDPNSAAVPP